MQEDTKTITYKATDKNMQCRGFQFELNKLYTQEGEIRECNNGFHACENPFDVWNYYNITKSMFFEVEQTGKKDSGDNKIASSEITFKTELNLKGFINAGFNFLWKKCYVDVKDESVQASSGDYTQQASSGYNTQQASSGYNTQQASSGYNTKQASSGNDTKQASSGDYTKQASSGNDTKQASSGDYTQQASSGDNTKHTLEGKASVMVSSGRNSTFKGVKGTLFCLTHYTLKESHYYIPSKFVTGTIGQDGVEENVHYGLDEDGNLIKVNE